MLWAWMRRARHRFPDATAYFAAPDHRNAASLRMLDKPGFTEGLWFDEPRPTARWTPSSAARSTCAACWAERRQDRPGPMSATSSSAPGPVDLTAIDTDATPGFHGDKEDGQGGPAGARRGLADLQERLFAERSAGSPRRPAARAAGHGHLRQGRRRSPHRRAGRPAGRADHRRSRRRRRGAAARLPVADQQALPEPGHIGVFDRSPLRGRADRPGPRVGAGRRRSSAATARSTTSRPSWSRGHHVLKCMLHISAETQKERLLARLDDPEKYWKYNPGDIDERAHWAAYREAYEIALERTNTEVAPWHVIPSDRKWLRNLAIGQLLHEALARHGPALARRRLRRRGAARAAGRRGAGPVTRDPDRRRHPLRHAAARGRQPARASSRPTTSAPTSASSAAPARACGCWSPR